MEDLYDDLLVFKGGPEVCADDVCESAISDVKTFGPLGQRWATFWRTVFGARFGIYRTSQVGERRGFKKDTYVACTAGGCHRERGLGKEGRERLVKAKKVDQFRVHPAREAEMDCTPSWNGHWRPYASPKW